MKNTHSTHLQPPFSGHFTASYFSVDTFYIRKDRSTRNKQQNDLNVLAQVVAYKGLHTPKKWSQLIRRGSHLQAVPTTVINYCRNFGDWDRLFEIAKQSLIS